jgi:XTP/dITP diphosphohydrolase
MDLLFVSTNGGKFREVKAILDEYGVRTSWSRRSLPELQADRLETVVKAKLEAAARFGPRVIVEDSGLFVPALRGFPGVYSSYALATIGLDGLLRLVNGRKREASFRTVAGLAIRNRTWTRSGKCHGRLADRPLGRNGFGYDPIFIPDGETQTFGQLEAAEKNLRSHRAKAIHSIGRLLQALESV